jgi:hypothetical protein
VADGDEVAASAAADGDEVAASAAAGDVKAAVLGGDAAEVLATLDVALLVAGVPAASRQNSCVVLSD